MCGYLSEECDCKGGALMSYNILLCGVGGQGTVLASKLLAATAGAADLTVHSAETIGMAQRGGPVTSHVRIGADAFSPLIPKGSADLIIAFEPAEAVRNLDYSSLPEDSLERLKVLLKMASKEVSYEITTEEAKVTDGPIGIEKIVEEETTEEASTVAPTTTEATVWQHVLPKSSVKTPHPMPRKPTPSSKP